MTVLQKGGCACGAVRYEISAEPMLPVTGTLELCRIRRA
jgi:hypothetical protein